MPAQERVLYMKIAIVDDEPIDLSTTRAYLCRYIETRYPAAVADMSIDAFAGGEEFLAVFRPGTYDLLILDIRMDNMSGIAAAQIVREQDDEVDIVFLTGSEDYLLEGYRVFAVGYFLKPLARNAAIFSKTFEHIFPRIAERGRKLAVRADGAQIEVSYRQICYVDINENHQPCIHLPKRDIITSMSYNDFMPLLSDRCFMECYHRIIVNMEFIKSMKQDDFILRTEHIVPISRRMKKEAKARYMSYLAHRNDTPE